MHELLAQGMVAQVRARVHEGDCPVSAPLSRENLEDLVIHLAAGPVHKTDDCGALLMGCVEELKARLVERGYPHLRVMIWINYEPGKYTATVEGTGEMAIPYIGHCDTLSDLMARARERIAAAPNGNAYDAWFVWAPAEAEE